MKKIIQWINQSRRNQIVAISVSVVMLGVIVASIAIPQMIRKNQATTNSDLEPVEEARTKDTGDLVSEHSIVIEAEKNTDYGVPITSSFILTHKKDIKITKKSIESELRTLPALAFDVEEVKPETFKISFRAPLPENKILRMSYTYEEEDFGYAFQTEEPFWVRSSYPANESVDVQVETGIEFTFSRKIDASIEDFIEISPATEGTFKVSDNKLIFLPKALLYELTEYEVHIKEGYILEGESLQEKELSFVTSRDWGNSFGFSGPKVKRLSEGESQALFMNGYVEEQTDVDIDVYLIEEQKEDILKLRSRKEIVDALTQTQKKDAYRIIKGDVLKLGDYNAFIQLKESLPKGLYYIAPNFGSGTEGGFFQVTSYYAYMTADENQLLVWIQGEENLVADIYINAKNIGKTNYEGIGSFPYTFAQNKDTLIVVECAKDTLYLPLELGEAYHNPRDAYYGFLTTDRRIYLPTDTINVNGFIQKREAPNPLDEVTLQLRYNDLVLETKVVELSEIGTFTSSFDIEAFNNQGLIVEVLVDKVSILNYWVNVFEFEKPKYVLASELNKNWVVQGEPFEWSGKLTYYSGAPVIDGSVILQLPQYSEYWKTFVTRTVNTRDKAEVSIKDEESEFNQTLYAYSTEPIWRPIWLDLSSRSNALDNYYLYQNNYLYLFPSDRMIEGSILEKENAGIRIDLNFHAIDVTKIKTDVTNPDEFRAEPASDMPIKVDITETYYEQVFVRQEYNEIYKETYNVYDYIVRETTVFSDNYTSDALGRILIDFDGIQPDRQYKIDVRGQDTKGHPILESFYYGSYAYSGGEGYEPYYSLGFEGDDYDRVNYNSEAKIRLLKDGKSIEASENDKMLVIEQREGIKKYVLLDETEYSFIFDETYMPNINMRVVYFTGDYIKATSSMQKWIHVKPESKLLNIEVSYDKTVYRPGEKVNYSLKVTDLEGKGIPADVNISVVDEAIFAIEESFVNPIHDLFSYRYSFNILAEYIFSFNTDPFWGGAEQGGEGGPDGIRSDFKNTPYFETRTTDNQGNLSGSFTLPDNITQWRATLTAFSKDVKATSIKTNLFANLPLFVDVVMEDTFLAEDSIGLLIKAAGDRIYRDEPVNLVMSLTDGAGKIVATQQVNTVFNEQVVFEIGKLPKGTYQLLAEATIKATTQNELLTDAMIKELKVVDSREYFSLNQTELLSKDTKFMHNNSIVTIDIMNEEARMVLNEFLRLTHGRTERRENLVASILSTRYINDVFMKNSSDASMSNRDSDEYYIHENSYRIKEYIQGDNLLISPLLNAEGDALVTASLLNVGINELLESYTLEQLKASFWTILDQGFGKSLEYNAALWGLSELEEPMLLRVNAALENYDSLESNETKICLIHSLAELGDTTKAKALLKRFLDEETINLASLDGSGLKLASTNRLDEMYRGMLLSLTVELQEWTFAENLYRYILRHKQLAGEEIYSSNQAEIYYYLRNRPQPIIEAELEYELSGKAYKEVLDFKTVVSFNLLPEELDTFKIKNIYGKLIVRKNFIGKASDVESSEVAVIKRTYSRAKEPEKPIEIGDEVFVTFTLLSEGTFNWFTLQDSLPAGLTFLETVPSQDNKLYTYAETKGNTTELFCFVRRDMGEISTNRTFSYLAMATLPGEYLAEQPLLYISYFEESVIGEETWISIKP